MAAPEIKPTELAAAGSSKPLGPLPPLSAKNSASVDAAAVNGASTPANGTAGAAAAVTSLAKDVAKEVVASAQAQAVPPPSGPPPDANGPSPFAEPAAQLAPAAAAAGSSTTATTPPGPVTAQPSAVASTKLSGKDVADAFKSAAKDHLAAGKEAGKTLKAMATLPFMKQPVFLTLDQIVSALFYLGLAFQLLLLKFIRPSLVWLIVFTVLGVGFGLGLSFVYYKNKRDKKVANQVLSLVLGQKGVQHLLGFLPTWFHLSEREKMEWLNDIIEELWPYIDKAVASMVKDITQRETAKVLKANKALGAAVTAIGFKHLTFGGAPFRVEGIHVSNKYPDAVVMEVDVRYAGDPNIALAITIPTGQKLCPRVTGISFVGSMRITLTPLVDRIPGFVALSATFMRQPLIKYELDFGKALGGTYLAAPVIPVVNYFVKDVLTKMLVWPQRLVVPVLQATDEDRLVTQRMQLRSQGLLRVKVIKAKDLPNKDTFGKNDVFAELTTDLDRIVTTTTKRNAGAEPVWEREEVFLLVQEPDNQDLRVSLLDRDLFTPGKLLTGQVTKVVNSADVIGRALIRLAPITAEAPVPQEAWHNLGTGDWGAAGGPGKGSGKVLLRCTYRPFSSLTKGEVEDAVKGILIVRVVGLKNITRSPQQKAMSVTVTIKTDRSESHDINTKYWSLLAEQRKLEAATRPILIKLYEFADSQGMFAEEEMVSYALGKLPKDLRGDIENLNPDVFRKLVDAKDTIGKAERPSPWHDRLADLVAGDEGAREAFKEYEKARMRNEREWFDVNFDYSNDGAGATAVFYDVTPQEEVKLKVLERSLATADEKLGRLAVAVSEVMSASDVDKFTGTVNYGYMHLKDEEMEESEDENGKKAKIEVIYRFVPYLYEPEDATAHHRHRYQGSKATPYGDVTA